MRNHEVILPRKSRPRASASRCASATHSSSPTTPQVRSRFWKTNSSRATVGAIAGEPAGASQRVALPISRPSSRPKAVLPR